MIAFLPLGASSWKGRMRRRDFVATGAAFAGSAISAGDAASEPNRYTLNFAPNVYDVTLQGAGLSLDCRAPGAPPAADPIAGAPMVTIGPTRRQVSWTESSRDQPAPSVHRLVLTAVEVPLEADLQFVHDASTGFVVRHTVLRNRGDGSAGDIDIRATLGCSIGIHEPIRTIVYLTGDHDQETEIRRVDADQGEVAMESRSGKTGFEFQPYVALLAEGSTYLCQLMWSGNWSMRVVPRPGGATLQGGLNNWRFRDRLRAGASLTLPAALFGRFDGTLGDATRRLHDYRRAHRPDPDRPIPVQYNSWYPYSGEPTAAALLPLVPIVKRLGCEAFVVDAGWYRTGDGESDADWDQRTGDWRTSRRRFPNGLREVSARCRDVGLRFGLWFEPETIGPTSSIRRDNPEWLHQVDGLPPAADGSAVLNLGVPAAWQHVYDRLTRMLQVVGVDWMKWDFNIDIGAGGWAPELPRQLRERAPLVAHYEGLYRLQDALRARFPDLILEMCAGGGGRMDGEILSRAHVYWFSDQSNALRKLAIHFGSQLAHPAVVCNDWLIDWPWDDADRTEKAAPDPRGDLPFRLRVAMLGTFGISSPIDRWPQADLQTASAHVELYKTHIRPIIHHGDQYYLTPPPPPDGDGDWAAIWYAAKNARSGVLFAFRLAGAATERRFRLPGLREDLRYTVSPFSRPPFVADGGTLAKGLAVGLDETYRSELCRIEALD